MAWDEWDDADMHVKSMKEDYSGNHCLVVHPETGAVCNQPLSMWDDHWNDSMCPNHYWEREKKKLGKPSKVTTGEIPF